ncbi:hypothetical protein VPH35_126823 [Triticum aestivum]
MGCSTSRASRSTADTPSPWTALPPDLLREVSGRLRHAADIVRFHAVCRSWRDAGALLSRPRCLPWVLTSRNNGQMLHSVVDFNRPHETPHRFPDVVLAEPPPANNNNRNLVVSSDGTAAWLFVAHPEPRLVNVLIGAVTGLPPLPDEIRMSMENLRGVVYGDDTIFLHTFINPPPSYWYEGPFIAAILHPGDATWSVRIERLKLWEQPYAMYHNGKVLVLTGNFPGRLLMMMDFETNGGDIRSNLELRWDVCWDINYFHECSYFLESHGELLLASILTKRCSIRNTSGDGHPYRVTLHTMRKEPGSGKMQWVETDGRNLGDHALFLGSPASFTVNLDEANGCAYFVLGAGVFRYSFINNETKLVQWLPSGCRVGDECVWLCPNLTFTPVHEIKEMLEA